MIRHKSADAMFRHLERTKTSEVVYELEELRAMEARGDRLARTPGRKVTVNGCWSLDAAREAMEIVARLEGREKVGSIFVRG